MLGGADGEGLAGDLVNFGFQRGDAGSEFGRETGQGFAVDLDPLMLHLRDHPDQRPVDQFIDAVRPLISDARLEPLPQAQGHVGVLRRIFSRTGEGHFGKADLVLARAHHVLEADAFMAQMLARGFVHAMARQRLARFQVETHDDGVVIGRDLDPVAAQDRHVIFEVLAHLKHGVIFQQWLELCEDQCLVELRGSLGEHVRAAMADRDVTGRVWCDCQADADKTAGYAIEHVGFGVHRDHAFRPRRRNPAVERLLRHHRFIQAAVDGRFVGKGGRRRRGLVRRCGRRRRHCNRRRRRAQPIEQGLEAMMLQKRLERFWRNALERQFLQRLWQVHRIMQRHQPARQSRHIGMGDQIFLHLGFLHGGRSVQRRLQSAIFGDELRRRLGADAGNARHIIHAIAHQRQHVAQLFWLHAELAHDIIGPAPLILHRVVHVDAGLDQLHQVLVGTDDRDMPTGRHGRPGIAGDDVIGLIPVFLDTGQGKGAGGVADHRELGNQVFRRGRAVRLILVVHVVAESVRSLVQDHGQMRRPLRLAQFLGQLPQHRRIAIDRAHRLAMPVGQRRKLVIGAENIARAVDEVEVILGHGQRDSLYPRDPPARYRVS